MSNVMQKSRKPEFLDAMFPKSYSPCSKYITNPASQVHATNYVLETRVLTTWVDKMAPSELSNPAQTLKNWSINDLPFYRCSVYVAMNRVANFG